MRRKPQRNPVTPARPVPDDIAEAREARRDAHERLDRAERRQPRIDALVSRLVERREHNHFGDSLSISMTRRGA